MFFLRVKIEVTRGFLFQNAIYRRLRVSSVCIKWHIVPFLVQPSFCFKPILNKTCANFARGSQFHWMRHTFPLMCIYLEILTPFKLNNITISVKSKHRPNFSRLHLLYLMNRNDKYAIEFVKKIGKDKSSK